MTRVLVGVLGNEAARYSEFWACMMRLKMPEGSVKDIQIGSDYVGAQNVLAQRCLDERFDFLWIMGDDHSFGPEMLERLLGSALEYDLPILVPLCTTRRAPFHLVTYGSNPDQNNPDPYLPISLVDVPGEGIIEIEAAGSAGMLIRRDVLEAVPSPWFQMTPRSEDIVFCEAAKAAGFKIHADLACRLGHILTCVVTPGLTDDGWVTGLTFGDLQMAIPTAEQLLVQEQEQLPPAVEVPETELHRQEVSLALGVPPGPSHPLGALPRQDLEEIHPLDLAGDMLVGEEIKTSMDAERIEIWVDDEFIWWWRAIGHDGAVLKKDSGVNEMTVIGTAHLFYPDVMVHQVQREVDDSRNLRPYGVPGRIWNRG
jgi:hypothetical protein